MKMDIRLNIKKKSYFIFFIEIHLELKWHENRFLQTVDLFQFTVVVKVNSE